MPTIMVQMADEKWTVAALHVACEHAVRIGAQVVLVEMIPSDYIDWLVSDPANYHFTESETEEIRTFQHIAEDCGVSLTVNVFKYNHSQDEALSDAADKLSADVVYATVPDSALPLFHRFHIRRLQHKLHDHHHELHILELPIAGDTPIEET